MKNRMDSPAFVVFFRLTENFDFRNNNLEIGIKTKKKLRVFYFSVSLILSSNVTPAERVRKKKHRVFEASSDIKVCYTEKFLSQKLEYIHWNPVKAGLCINPEDYYYSSARFYYDGTDSFGMLTHYSGN